jgi:hypothetical protein
MGLPMTAAARVLDLARRSGAPVGRSFAPRSNTQATEVTMQEHHVADLRSAAFDNYCAYLPPAVERWGIVFDGAFHRSIIEGLVDRIENTSLFDIREIDPRALVNFAHEHIDDNRVGVLGFLVNQPSFDAGYSTFQRDALAQFNRWPARRMKVCFEAWDGNFHSLFAERPRDVRARCLEMQDRVSTQTRILYSSEDDRRDDLDIDCDGVHWVTQTGFEDTDYILPTGEVATCPKSVEGVVAPGGWIIGTLPLGAKYGLISPGEIVLRFSRGQIIGISGTNQKLCADFEMVLTRLPSLLNVSEVAVGMSLAIANTATTHPVGHLWHERHFGFHIGLGALLPETAHSHLECTGHHLDVVFAHGALRGSDGSEIIAW